MLEMILSYLGPGRGRGGGGGGGAVIDWQLSPEEWRCWHHGLAMPAVVQPSHITNGGD